MCMRHRRQVFSVLPSGSHTSLEPSYIAWQLAKISEEPEQRILRGPPLTCGAFVFLLLEGGSKT